VLELVNIEKEESGYRRYSEMSNEQSVKLIKRHLFCGSINLCSVFLCC